MSQSLRRLVSRWLHRERVFAVSESQLDGFLDRTGLKPSIEDGSATCAYCGRPVGLESIEAFVVRDGRYRLACSKFDCLTLLSVEAERR